MRIKLAIFDNLVKKNKVCLQSLHPHPAFFASVCLCSFLFVCPLCLYCYTICLRVCVFVMPIKPYVYTVFLPACLLCLYVCIFVYLNAYVSDCKSVYVYICIFIYLFVCLYVCVSVCLCVIVQAHHQHPPIPVARGR